MTDEKALRVAVLGVGGIGKHHAKWWHIEGADVCAFLGSTSESVIRAVDMLKDMFWFAGTGYTSLHELLVTETPDIVDVCTPTELHYRHARSALEAGCHVLCEKPFVYDRELSDETMLDQARELLTMAAPRRRLFGVCTQYVVATRHCLAMAGNKIGRIERFHGHLVSPTRGRSPDPHRTWVDLAPHMLGAVQAACPGAKVRWDSLKLDFAGHRAHAQFQVAAPGGDTVDCDILTDHTDAEPKNIRRLTFNDYTFDIGGFNDENGTFQARIHTPDGDHDCEDAMRVLIRQFKEGRPAVPGPMALQNLEWMLKVLASARQ